MKKRWTGGSELSSKLLTGVAVLWLASMGGASANEVYIEQVGTGSTITINQDGADNRIGTSNSPAYIGSGSNTVNIDQIGSTNQLDMIVNGSGTDVTVSTTGSNNIQEIACGTTNSAGCSASTITQTIVGDANDVKQLLGTGANHTSTISITGDTNTVTHTSTNAGTTATDITVTGDTNVVSVIQSGLLNKNVVVTSTGNSNNIAIVQSD